MPTSISFVHALDHPVWNALISRQQALAEGGAVARRYPPAIAPFAAMTDVSPQGFVTLRAVMSRPDHAVLFPPGPVTPPAEFKLPLAKTAEQMIGKAAETSVRA